MNNPLFYTPPGIHRSFEQPTQSAVRATQIMRTTAVTLALTSIPMSTFSLRDGRSVIMITEELKKIRREFQRKPDRNDLKLKILDLQAQLKQLNSKPKSKSKKRK